jgi:hypothetical protein
MGRAAPVRLSFKWRPVPEQGGEKCFLVMTVPIGSRRARATCFRMPPVHLTPRDTAAVSDNLTRFCRGSSFAVGVNGTSALAGTAEVARIADEIRVAAQVPRP